MCTFHHFNYCNLSNHVTYYDVIMRSSWRLIICPTATYFAVSHSCLVVLGHNLSYFQAKRNKVANHPDFEDNQPDVPCCHLKFCQEIWGRMFFYIKHIVLGLSWKILWSKDPWNSLSKQSLLSYNWLAGSILAQFVSDKVLIAFYRCF